MTGEERDWLRLHLTPGLGRLGLMRLMEAFGSAEAILEADPRDWKIRAGVREKPAGAVPARGEAALEKTCERLASQEVRIIPFCDRESYPSLLRTIPDPPALLYMRGTLPPAEALAVVGARQASESGRRLTEAICSELASRGIAIVSGLARGIDTAAHRGALAAGGFTVAVLGCGIDTVYPPENRRLYQQIAQSGAILSEYPPGAPPLAGHFPGRNRIISGLCRGTLIVEAAEKSGSLITADFALEQGREVFAVPGPVFAPTAGGVNGLLKDGAHLVTEAEDILGVLWPRLPSPAIREREDALVSTLGATERKVYDLLGPEPLHIDDIARKSALTPMEVSAILLHLELQGGVSALPGMRFARGINVV